MIFGITTKKQKIEELDMIIMTKSINNHIIIIIIKKINIQRIEELKRKIRSWKKLLLFLLFTLYFYYFTYNLCLL